MSTRIIYLTIVAIITIIFHGGICRAQSSPPAEGSQWGQVTNGVQLSITLNTNRFVQGDTTTVVAWIKNSSSNMLYVAVSNPRNDFEIELLDPNGKVIQLNGHQSRFPFSSRNFRMQISPGESQDFRIPIILSKSIAPGTYTMSAATRCRMDKDSFDATSNGVRIEILP